jgi:SET domain-containing protein
MFAGGNATHQYNPGFSRAHVHARAPMISMYIKNPMTQASAASNPAATPADTTNAAAPKASGRRIQVRKSGVHGKGVFSVAPLKKGEVLIEYKGEVIPWKEALRRHPHDPKDPDHTFYFHIDDKNVIDAKFGGNAARWINHACTPNCEADEIDGRIFIKALRAIKPDTELFYDYGLIIDEPYTKKLKKQFECRCGTKGCRGTMLAPKR